jgi:hypothetical protein
MIDIDHEQLRLLTKAADDVPGRPHISTMIRWALRGVKGTRLETVMVGGRRFTSIEAIQRFLTRLNEPGALAAQSPSEKRKLAIAQTDAMLDVEGI